MEESSSIVSLTPFHREANKTKPTVSNEKQMERLADDFSIARFMPFPGQKNRISIAKRANQARRPNGYK